MTRQLLALVLVAPLLLAATPTACTVNVLKAADTLSVIGTAMQDVGRAIVTEPSPEDVRRANRRFEQLEAYNTWAVMDALYQHRTPMPEHMIPTPTPPETHP